MENASAGNNVGFLVGSELGVDKRRAVGRADGVCKCRDIGSVVGTKVGAADGNDVKVGLGIGLRKDVGPMGWPLRCRRTGEGRK